MKLFEPNPAHGNRDDHEFHRFVESINWRFVENIVKRGERLFTTDAKGLFKAYLSGFPEETRKGYDCRACQKFIEKFGSLVTIDEVGITHSAIWEGCNPPERFAKSVEAMLRILQGARSARITGMFLSKEYIWGTPKTGNWHHFYVKATPAALSNVWNQRREEFSMVSRAVDKYSPHITNNAIRVLQSGQLSRVEKVLKPAQWFNDLSCKLHTTPSPLRNNLIWKAVADAPPAFCHIEGTLLGSLLSDIKAGKGFTDIKKRFNVKVDPVRYMRPTSDPTELEIQKAELLVEKLGLKPSLERRYAQLEEICALWRPKPLIHQKPGMGSGVFGHLKAKNSYNSAFTVERQRVTMTWTKFANTVLLTAAKIELMVPSAGSFTAIMTAVHGDAPPILKHDVRIRGFRNPFSMYMYKIMPSCELWNLKPTWTEVTAITLHPRFWGEIAPKTADVGIIFVLFGARDLRLTVGSALFPEELRTELHEVRRVIEAYSNATSPLGREEATACGISYSAPNHSWNQLVRVTDTAGETFEVLIDRWD